MSDDMSTPLSRLAGRVSGELTADEAHVVLDVIAAFNPETTAAAPWDQYTTDPAADPKAGHDGWVALLHSAAFKLTAKLEAK